MAKGSTTQAAGSCACGAVRLEIDVPAVWAWHDHSPASRHPGPDVLTRGDTGCGSASATPTTARAPIS